MSGRPEDDASVLSYFGIDRALTPARITRCVLESLAAGYARTLQQATRLASVAIDVVHVVGGGSQNELLCQLTADATGIPVLAGPAEGTALGNVLVQARSAGAVPPPLDDLRAAIAAATPVRRYAPR